MKRFFTVMIFILSALSLYADGSETVTIYTKPGCSRCEYTVNYLKNNNISYAEYSTADQPSTVKMWGAIRSSGTDYGTGVTMPVVTINDKTYFSMKDLKGFTASIPSLLAAGQGGGKIDANISSGNKEQQGSDAPPVNKYFYIKAVEARSRNLGYWDQPGYPKKFKKGDNLSLYSKDNHIDQQFRFISAGNGMYYIESKNKGIVDVSGNKSENGTNVLIWSGHGGSNQLFRFRHIGYGRWKIYANNGRIVCTDGSYENKTNVRIWEDNDGAGTEWYFEDVQTGMNYTPVSEVKEKYTSEAEFFTKNEDKVFNVTIGARESIFRGKAYADRRGGFGNLILVIETSGPDPISGIQEKINSTMILKYDSKTGEYKGYFRDGYLTGEVTGRVAGNSNVLSMRGSQGAISFEITGNLKSSVIPESPDFFIINKNKVFEYKSKGMEHRMSGTAKVKQITGNKIELAFESSGSVGGEAKTQTGIVTLYYEDGIYTTSVNDGEPSAEGRASGSSKSLDMGGDWGLTFSVK